MIHFEVSVLIELNGSPGLISNSDIELLEIVLLDAYNLVAGCDTPGAFITATNVTILVDAVDSFGDNINTESDMEMQFTWLVIFSGECRGCPITTRALFDGEDEAAPQCSCAFPLASAYAIQCNELIEQRFSQFPASIMDATSIFSNGTAPEGGPSKTFSTFVTISGSSPGSGSFTTFQLNLVTQAFLETYNHLNALNPDNCDTGERVIIAVTPFPTTGDGRRLQNLPFSIVFQILGMCRDCPSATLIFGDHEPSPQDENAICPAGSTLRCPTEQEFLDAFDDAIDRTEIEYGVDLLDVDTIQQSTDSPPTAMPVPVPCTPVPTRAPVAPFPVFIDLNEWTISDTNGNWVVDSSGNSVQQTVNGDPTFFCSDFAAFGNDLAGVICVNSGAGDDDFIGFALGYESSQDADFLLVDWKRNNQNFGSARGLSGLAAVKVQGIPLSSEYWGHQDFDGTPNAFVEELARGTSLGSTGWNFGVDYTF